MTENERYQRQIALPQLGASGQQKIAGACVLVVGAGGLGCPALQYLAAAGVGKLIVVDFDAVSASNLNRQILFHPGDIGKNKAQAAVEHLRIFNPDLNYLAVPKAFDETVATTYLAQCDVVLDCTDRPSARYTINDLCVQFDKPFVYAGIHRFEGQLAVFNYRGGSTYRCAFPEPDEKVISPTCEENGVLGTVPGILGVMQASETLKLIAMEKNVDAGALHLYDFLSGEAKKIRIPKREDQNLQKHNQVKDITASDLIDRMHRGEKFSFLDIRESHEHTAPEALQDKHLPTSEWDADRCIDVLEHNPLTVIYCQHGIRSIAAIETLPKKAREKVLNLRGGLAAYHRARENMNV